MGQVQNKEDTLQKAFPDDDFLLYEVLHFLYSKRYLRPLDIKPLRLVCRSLRAAVSRLVQKLVISGDMDARSLGASMLLDGTLLEISFHASKAGKEVHYIGAAQLVTSCSAGTVKTLNFIKKREYTYGEDRHLPDVGNSRLQSIGQVVTNNIWPSLEKINAQHAGCCVNTLFSPGSDRCFPALTALTALVERQEDARCLAAADCLSTLRSLDIHDGCPSWSEHYLGGVLERASRLETLTLFGKLPYLGDCPLPALKTLVIESYENVYALAKLFSRCWPKLHMLLLNGSVALDAKVMGPMEIPGSPLLPNLVFLKMKYENVHTEGFRALLFPNLRSLTLTQCFCGADAVAGARDAAVALANLPRLRELVLYMWPTDLFNPLCELVTSVCMARLTVLSLSGCFSEGSHHAQWVDLIGSCCPRLRVLNLGGIPSVKDVLEPLVYCGLNGKLPRLEGLGTDAIDVEMVHCLCAVWPCLQVRTRTKDGDPYYERFNFCWKQAYLHMT